jgi:hypothetical protein
VTRGLAKAQRESGEINFEIICLLILVGIQPITHHGIYSMVHCAETSQFDVFCVFYVFCVAVAPFFVRDIGVCIGVHEDIEGTSSLEHGKECD